MPTCSHVVPHAGMNITAQWAVQHHLAQDEGKSAVNLCESSCTALTSEVAETPLESSQDVAT